MPGDRDDVLMLRPLTGATDEVVAIHRQLSTMAGYSNPDERPRSASFPAPSVDDLSDATGAHLLWQAARLTLREGATPLRSLGRVSIRPRTYQFVPLLMALRLDPVRILIADDVGVGKTIEALLVAREMLDRGEVKRLCVLCPPYLCEQWQKELSEKFNLDAVIIRSGTVGQLERGKTSPESIYKHYPIQVVSIDFVKSDRNRHTFLLDCPELVIVDEAHGAAAADTRNTSQHQRHALIHEIAKKMDRHMMLLTATPHSGVEGAFLSLLGLIRNDFEGWPIANLNEPQRVELARHFVQRTRGDIEKDWEGQHCFPKRVPSDETYRLSDAYRELFGKTYDFCSELVRTGQALDGRQQRVRYWGALALLRCVMSSPAAALAAVENRHGNLPASEDEADFRTLVFESGEERTDDSQPTPTVESAEAMMDAGDRRRLLELGRLAAKLAHTKDDTKLAGCAKLVGELLRKGFHPIVWCRYIATAEYVAEGLRRAFKKEFDGLRVVAITGNLSDDERRTIIDELSGEKMRVLVATDCVSEGVNLQRGFSAAIHYDLPWNPNRLEQREGRVDRYGQIAPVVKTIRYFSPDSAVDGVVLRVLLDKAREIHQALGTHVPVPDESESVTEAVLNALFLRGKQAADDSQMELGLDMTAVGKFHRQWDMDAAREKLNRTRFAQRALKPDEVRRELEATDAVLGDPEAVRHFVLDAAQRLGLSITPDRKKDVYRIAVSTQAKAALPDAISFVLPGGKASFWSVSFISPTPEGAEYLGRNHRFVSALAQYLMEEAITRPGTAHASRCGVIRSRVVSNLTTLYLTRVRYLLEQPERTSLLAEEVQILGHDSKKDSVWLPMAEALRLLAEAKPDANIPMDERKELITAAMTTWKKVEPVVKEQMEARATELAESHRRVRQAVSLKVRNLAVKPQMPPDLLGILVLQPLI
ncbi:MAG: helicase-related protein [bacterium]